MFLRNLVILVVVSQFGCGHCRAKDYMFTQTKSPLETIKDWKHLEQQVQSFMDDMIKQIMPVFVRASSEVEISPECSGSLLKMIMGIRSFKDWAVRMLDATGKPGGGQLLGSSSALGSYKECLDIVVDGGSGKSTFKGMYCIVEIRPPLPPPPKVIISGKVMPLFENYTSSIESIEKIKNYIGLMYTVGFKLGLCVPSACSHQDVKEIARAASEPLKLSADIEYCDIQQPVQIYPSQWVILILYAIIILSVVTATVLQCFYKYEKSAGVLQRLVYSLSASTNLRSLLNTSSRTEEDGSLSCFQGIRFFSITWIVLAHTYAFNEPSQIREAINGVDYLKGVLFQCIANSCVAVDTFFFITSAMVSFNSVKKLKRTSPSLLIVLFVRRIIRLLPSAMLVVSFMLLLPLIGSGPLWKSWTGLQIDNCWQNWWAIPLFINNFIHPVDMCVGPTWYISVDLQLFVVALLFITIYTRNPILAKSLLALFGILCTIITICVTWYMEMLPTILPTVTDVRAWAQMFHYNYVMPYSHGAVYALGLIVGVLLARNSKIHISRRLRIVGWFLAVICNLSVLYTTVIWNNGSHYPVGIFPSIYSGLHRTLWALGLTWVTVVCASGNGGIVNDLLTWKGYAVLNRASYMVYLIQFPIIFYYQGILNAAVENSHTTFVIRFLGYLNLSFGLSFFLFIVFEAPVKNIESMIFERLSSRSPKVPDVDNHVSPQMQKKMDAESGSGSTKF